MKSYTLPLISLLILATGCQLASAPQLTPQPAATLVPSSTPTPALPFGDLEPFWSDWVAKNAPGPLVVYCKGVGDTIESGVHVEAGQSESFDSWGNPVPPTNDGGLITFQTDNCTYVWVNGIKVQANPSLTLRVSAGKGLVYHDGSGQIGLPSGKTLVFGSAVSVALSNPTSTPPPEPTTTNYSPPLQTITPVSLEKISPANAGYLSPLDDIHLTDPNNVFNELYLQQMAISPDHAYIILVLQKASQDPPTNIVRVLNIATGEILSETEAPASLALNADGLHYAAYSDNTIHVYEVFGGKQVNSWPVQTPVENGLFFSPDGAYLAIQDATNGVEVWDLNQGVSAGKFDPGGPIQQAVFSQDDRSLALLESSQVEVYDIHGGAIRVAYPKISENGQFDVRVIAISPDGSRVAAAGLRNGSAELKLLDATSTGGGAGWSNHLPDSHFTDLKFSPDGKWLAFATTVVQNHTVTDTNTYLFDAATAGLKQTLKVEAGLAFSQDGQYFAGSMADGSLQIWDLQTGASLAGLYGHTATDYDVQFSRDGTLLASSSSDSTIRLWGYPAAGTAAARAGLHVTDENSFSINGFSANSVAGSIPSSWITPGASPARYQVVLSYQKVVDTVCMYTRFANVGVPGATPVPLGGPQVRRDLVRVDLTVTVTDLADLKPVAQQVFNGKPDPAWKDCPQEWQDTWGDNLNISKLDETEFAAWLQTALAPFGFTP